MDLGNFNINENEINAGGINIPLIKGDKRRTRYSRNTAVFKVFKEKQELVMY